MMPLTLSDIGEESMITRIGGQDQVRKHLEKIGFVPGSFIKIVSKTNDNVIVKVKESRIAISKEMAIKIMVE